MVYRLTYFDITGRAEVIRLLFVLAGVSFQDNRIQRDAWPKLKPTTPWGQLPYLEEDSKVLAQTIPIMHYLGEKHGFGGDGPWEQALVSSVCEASNDLFTALSNVMMMEDSDEKHAAVEAFGGTMKSKAIHFDRFIAEHGKNNFTVGSKMTSADICVFNIFNQIDNSGLLNGEEYAIDYNGPDAHHRHLKGVYDKINDNPRVADYLKTRKPDLVT